ncbi:lysylphosphatidylglycerol synthase transmembrane domain-containing protein [Bartonella sp. F02]|uniref:lysylphosphatidylglycerol synthase transmembrane domain-containing protein n=1 Tax=Bartonella sp. F02 TaxID=2967262 RepID=UPI0022A90197|nr:YbhN family protein [Bartonella sp. F02]MCZ2328632.1 lysylphosphatidylglycerol synthase domain-containing protein [Bartonella sp. F02]
MKFKNFIWPLIGIIAMIISIRVLYIKLSAISFNDVLNRLNDLNIYNWLFACFCSLIAYASLAGYDRIALQHLGRKISWIFITICSFTTYALSHNIGASVFSGAVVRYRAYKVKGLSGSEIAILVGFCSFTFAIGIVLLSGIVLIAQPQIITLVYSDLPIWLGRIIGVVLLTCIALYIFGSWLQLKPISIGKKFKLSYPKLKIVIQQLIISPLEILGAAGIIYAVLPHGNDIYFISVLGVFLASFSITLLSNAPAGGVGVLEALFITGMPTIDPADVIAALIVFRMLYLIIPFILSLFFVAIFEIQQYRKGQNKNHVNQK